MFDIFQKIEGRGWFQKPEADLKLFSLCSTSGLAPNPNCPVVEKEMVMESKMLPVCHYQTFHIVK